MAVVVLITARVGKELELSFFKESSRTVLHCAH
jgi:hypothetical protein